MSRRGKATISESFLQRLDELRAKIDLLPQEQHQHFHKLADDAERQCEKLQKDNETIRVMLDDLRLIEKQVRLDGKTSQREIR